MTISTVGLDLAKSVFQVHAVDRDGTVVVRKRLRRNKVLAFFAELPPCLVGMEACGSAHHWARELKLLGHEVRLMPPHYVKPYVKRGKNDAADAEAICEAVTRPSMRFVPVKGTEQQSVLMLHRTRSLLVRQRTMLANALRSHLSEFGIVVAKGIENIAKLAAIVETEGKSHLPPAAVDALSVIIGQLRDLKGRSASWTRRSCAGIARTRRAAVWRPYRASARSRPRPSPPPSPMPLSSSRAGNWPRGWDWSPGRPHPVARKGSAGSRSKGTAISDSCW